MISIIELWGSHSQSPTWGDIQAGDGVSYPDGSLFIVDARAMDDGKQVTFLMRCVVSPTAFDYQYNDVVALSKENNEPLPEGVTFSSGGFRDVR
jgi:hypothetical protein